MKRIAAVILMLACGPILAATPASHPATSVTTAPAQAHPRPMSGEFAVLLSRSIFVKGRQTVAGYGSSRGGSESVFVVTTQQASSPEKNLVFNGVTLAGGRADALVEDMAAGKVSTVKVGDAIARGWVAAITLDSLDYESGGKMTHVLIGQDLEGMAGPPPSSQPTTAPSGGGASDVLERMRLRRQQELNGGK